MLARRIGKDADAMRSLAKVREVTEMIAGKAADECASITNLQRVIVDWFPMLTGQLLAHPNLDVNISLHVAQRRDIDPARVRHYQLATGRPLWGIFLSIWNIEYYLTVGGRDDHLQPPHIIA